MTIRLLAPILGAMMLLAGLGACSKPGGEAGAGDAGAKTAVLRVGSQKGGTKALMTAAGVLDGAPYRIEWSEFPAAQHLLEALGAGAIDLGQVGDAPFLFAYASGSNIKAVQTAKAAGGGASTAILVRGASPLRSLADLKGKKIATGRGSVGHYLVLRALEAQGLKPADAQIVFLSPADAKAAFETGAIDAWSTWGVYVGLATLHGDARVLTDGRNLMSGLGFEAANAASIPAKEPQIRDFLRRLAAAQRWEDSHKAEGAAMLAKETGAPADVAAYVIDLARTLPVPIDPPVIAEVGKTLAGFQAAGAIPAGVDIAGAFDPRFNDAAKP